MSCCFMIDADDSIRLVEVSEEARLPLTSAFFTLNDHWRQDRFKSSIRSRTQNSGKLLVSD